jgi:hypothetical protein
MVTRNGIEAQTQGPFGEWRRQSSQLEVGVDRQIEQGTFGNEDTLVLVGISMTSRGSVCVRRR